MSDSITQNGARGCQRFLGAARLLLATGLGLCTTLAPAQQATPQTLHIVGGLAGIHQYVQQEQPFWTKKLRAVSGGKFDATIVPFDSSGVPAQDMLRLMQMGVIPFGTALISRVAAQDSAFNAPDLAGLNPDLATLKRNVAAFRPYLERTLRQRYRVELLAIYIYPAQMLFCQKPLARLADLAGRRVRVSGASASDFVAAFGGVPVITEMAKLIPAIKSGSVECAVTGTMSGNTLGLHAVTHYQFALPITWGLSLFGANIDSWNALDPALRALLRDQLPKLEAEIWSASAQETNDGLACNTGAAECRNGTKGKMVLVTPSASDLRRSEEVLRTLTLPKWLARCGRSCAAVWNQTLGPVTGVAAQAEP